MQLVSRDLNSLEVILVLFSFRFLLKWPGVMLVVYVAVGTPPPWPLMTALSYTHLLTMLKVTIFQNSYSNSCNVISQGQEILCF